MSLYYFDTSALVKYYVTEPRSTWVRQLNALLTQAKLALIFVSGDKQQLTAAEIEGLTVEDPFNHLSSTDTLPSV
jgi:hypothetical protein